MNIETLQSDTHTKIWYFNNGGVCDHILILDLENKIIQVEVSEYDDNGKRLAERVYGADGVTEITHRLYDENGWRDYRKINGEWVLTQWTRDEWLVADQFAKCSWYNGQNELVCYDLFEFDDEIGEMMKMAGSFDVDGQNFGWDNPPEKAATLQSYTDY